MRWILILILFQALTRDICGEGSFENGDLDEAVSEDNTELDDDISTNNNDVETKETEHNDAEIRSKRGINPKKNNSNKKEKLKKKGKNGKKQGNKGNKKGKLTEGRKKWLKNRKKKKINNKVKKKNNKPKKRKKKKKKSGKDKKKTDTDTEAERAAADVALYKGPWGFEHTEEIDWTKPEYRCPECEDTLILYDPWWAPPPTLHIPIFCTSNLSSYSSSDGIHNFGPNLTFIWIPGSLNCSNPAKLRADVQFSVEISQNTSSTTGSDQTYYDCGENEGPHETEVGCKEDMIEHHTNKTSQTCFWHMYAFEHWRRQLEFTHWHLPLNDCPDVPDKDGKRRGFGECCESGPHLRISWTGYAKGLKTYCGPDAPEFWKTEFDKGRARWLIIYNNTAHDEDGDGHDDHVQDGKHLSFDFKAPTIGYRRTSAIDQYYYGQRCECGLKVKPPNNTKKKQNNTKKPKTKQNKRTKGSKKKKSGIKKKKNQSKGKKKKNNGTKKKKNQSKVSKKNKMNGKNNGKTEKLLSRFQRDNVQINKNKKGGNKNGNKKIKKKKNITKGNKKGKNKKKTQNIKKGKNMKKKKKNQNIKKRKTIKKKKKNKKKGGKKGKEAQIDYDYDSEYYDDIKAPKTKQFRKAKQLREEAGDPTVRQLGEWPWMASLTYDNKYVCSGYAASPQLVVALTKCFHIIDGMSFLEMNAKLNTTEELNKIVVVVYDKEVEKVDTHDEQTRSVSSVFINPDCDPVRLPQYCILVLKLDEKVDMDGEIFGKPKPVCSTCFVSSFDLNQTKASYPVKLRGYPFLVGYGLKERTTAQIKYGAYKADKYIYNKYTTAGELEELQGLIKDKSECSSFERVGDHFSNVTESYCMKQFGNKYTCDKAKTTINGKQELGTRDYGSPLLQRIGRSGYKIVWQVVALLWDFDCASGVGNAIYIPTWGFTQWLTELMYVQDEPCIKRVRNSLFTRKIRKGTI